MTVQSVSLAARGLDAVLLVARRPGSAIGVDLCRARLVEVGLIDLAGLRLGSQLIEFLAGLGKGGSVSLISRCGACVSIPARVPSGFG